jgi:hypothetical protein
MKKNWQSIIAILAPSFLALASVDSLAQKNNSQANQAPQSQTYQLGPNGLPIPASSNKFAGAYGQVGIGYQSVSQNISTLNYRVGNGATYGAGTNSNSSNGFGGTVSFGYNFQASPTAVLGLGIELSPIATKAANFGGSTATTPNIPSSTYKMNNQYNIYFSPGVVIDEYTALYGKVGYTGMQLTSGPNSNSVNFRGYSLGGGYRSYLSGNWYAFLEGNYYKYGQSTDSGTAIMTNSSTSYTYSNTSSVSSYNVLYGLGYKF